MTVLRAVFSGNLGPGAVAGALPSLANFVREDRNRGGVRVGAFRDVLFSGTYAVAWLLALALFVLGGIVVGVPNVVPFLGFVVRAFVSFYVALAPSCIHGRGFADAMPVDEAPEAPSGRPAARPSGYRSPYC